MHTHGLRSLPPGTKDFDTIHGTIQSRADLAIPDITVALDKLRFTDLQTVEVPGAGHFQLTDWSQGQLASLLGIRWDKWFQTVSPGEMATEINRRFMRTSCAKKLRLSRHPNGSSHSDGILRGIVGPKYSAVDDIRVFNSLAENLSADLSEVQFVRSTITTRGSQFAGVSGSPVDLGTAERPDHVFPGFLVRNSEVGFSALTLDTFLFRLVCSNGLTLMVENERLLYRTHRPIDSERLSNLLTTAFEKLTTSTDLACRRLGRSRQETIEDPAEIIETVVRGSQLPVSSRKLVMEAYNEEPEPTRYGIVQAFTRAAQNLPPDEGFEMEKLAGKYLTAA